MNPPNVNRTQQSILLDDDKVKKLDRLAGQLGVSKQALMREAVDDLLSVHGFFRSPRIQGIRHVATQCMDLMKEIRHGKLSESDVHAASERACVYLENLLTEIGGAGTARTSRERIPRTEG